MTIELDHALAARLRMVADQAGARDLPLGAIVRGLLVQATEELEAQRAARVPITEPAQVGT